MVWRTAVLLSAPDFDDLREELDREFQESLKLAAKEYRTGKAISLQDYLKRGWPHPGPARGCRPV